MADPTDAPSTEACWCDDPGCADSDETLHCTDECPDDCATDHVGER